MSEVSLGELVRRLEKLEAKGNDYVSKDLFNATLKNIEASIRNVEEDVAESKENLKWTIRLVVTQLIGAIVYILTEVITNAPS